MYMAYTRLYNNIVDEGGCIWRHVVSNQIIWLGCTIIVAQVTQQQHNTCTWHNLVWVQAMQACRYCYTGWTTCRALRVQSSQEKVSVCQLKKYFFIWFDLTRTCYTIYRSFPNTLCHTMNIFAVTMVTKWVVDPCCCRCGLVSSFHQGMMEPIAGV